MSLDWNAFVSSAEEDRARAYLFKWTLPPPLLLLGNVIDVDPTFLIKSASIPESSVEEMSVYWKGVQCKIGGTRRYSDWTVTVLCDKNSYIRMLAELWMSTVSNVVGTIVNGQPNIYAALSTTVFTMLDNDGNSTLLLTFYYPWPKSIGPISLDYGTQDFAQFDITFSYLYHVMVPSMGLL